MARVPLIDDTGRPELTELADRIRGERRGSLINVYRLLLHSAPVAETWFDHINAVRWGTVLAGRLREILIIRIGHVNKVAYVVNQHVPRLAIPEGLSVAECDALADWRAGAMFSKAERAALAYVDAMTKDIKIPDALFNPLRDHFNDREIVEITVLAGTYNMHTRVVQALEIDPEPASDE